MRLTNLLSSNSVLLKNLGLVSYTSAMKTMKEFEDKKKSFLRKEISVEPHDTLLICQHNPVYTVGIRRKDYMDQETIENLRNRNSEFYYTDRGGLITFHGPGQLVCYPVLNLKHYNPSIRCYINMLEEVIIRTCANFGTKATRTDDVGIWVGNDKIAAIGVHCRRYITSHGIALNCNTDLSWFRHIVPCGLVGKGVTSLSKELNNTVTIKQALPYFLQNFENVFNCNLMNDDDF